jgi:3-polyprenyl-4-hydroxybenzoate decarboxylase
LTRIVFAHKCNQKRQTNKKEKEKKEEKARIVAHMLKKRVQVLTFKNCSEKPYTRQTHTFSIVTNIIHAFKYCYMYCKIRRKYVESLVRKNISNQL